MPIAVIPVKQLRHSKSRLNGLLSEESRAQLTTALLRHTLAALAELPQIERRLTISPDPAVLQLATELGAEGLPEEDFNGADFQGGEQGLNQALSQAASFVSNGGNGAEKSLLFLPADLPLITPEAIAQFIAGDASCQMRVCPDRHYAGSNALLLNPPQPFTFRFGANSFIRHFHEAVRHGLSARILPVAGLQFDLDTEKDWRDFHARPNTIQFLSN